MAVAVLMHIAHIRHLFVFLVFMQLELFTGKSYSQNQRMKTGLFKSFSSCNTYLAVIWAFVKKVLRINKYRLTDILREPIVVRRGSIWTFNLPQWEAKLNMALSANNLHFVLKWPFYFQLKRLFLLIFFCKQFLIFIKICLSSYMKYQFI